MDMELLGNRLGRFSLKTRRLFVGIALVPALLSVFNYYLGWGCAGRFAREAMALTFAALLLVMRYLGPTVGDLRRYRATEGKSGEPGP
jgi:hypothetical protein